MRLTDEQQAFAEAIQDFCAREFGTREKRIYGSSQLHGADETRHQASLRDAAFYLTRSRC